MQISNKLAWLLIYMASNIPATFRKKKELNDEKTIRDLIKSDS
jgi:hypothetical protein